MSTYPPSDPSETAPLRSRPYCPPYHPAPRDLFEGWCGQLQAASSTGAVLDRAAVATGLDRWQSSVHPSTSAGEDGHGPYVDLVLRDLSECHSLADFHIAPTRSAYRLDPEGALVVLLHLAYGGSVSLKRSKAKGEEGRLDYLSLGSNTVRVDLARAFLDLPPGKVALDSGWGGKDCRRGGYRIAPTVADVRASGRPMRTPRAGRGAAISFSLGRFDANHAKANLGLDRDAYRRLLYQAYALLDARRPLPRDLLDAT